MRGVLLVGMAVAAACGAASPAGAAVLSGPADLSVAGHAADVPQVAATADGAVIAAWAGEMTIAAAAIAPTSNGRRSRIASGCHGRRSTGPPWVGFET